MAWFARQLIEVFPAKLAQAVEVHGLRAAFAIDDNAIRAILWEPKRNKHAVDSPTPTRPRAGEIGAVKGLVRPSDELLMAHLHKLNRDS